MRPGSDGPRGHIHSSVRMCEEKEGDVTQRHTHRSAGSARRKLMSYANDANLSTQTEPLMPSCMCASHMSVTSSLCHQPNTHVTTEHM